MAQKYRAPRQVAVVGLGRFGSVVAKTLAAQGYEVLGIDRAEEPVQRAKDVVTHAIQAELGDIALVRALGLDEMEIAVVAIGSDLEASVFSTALLVEAGVRQVIARASSPLHGTILTRVGATRVVYPEADSGVAVAHSLRAPGIVGYLGLGADVGVSALPAPAEWAGRTLRELRLPEQGPVVVLAIQRGEETIAVPEATERVVADDLLLILVQDSKLGKLPRNGRR